MTALPPAAPAAGEPHEPHEPPLQAPPGMAVAVVDDDGRIREVLLSWLGTLGHRGLAFASAEDLLAQARPAGGHWWLPAASGQAAGPLALAGAVLDLHLPGMGGADLALRLRQSSPGLRSVIISAAGPDLLAQVRAALPGTPVLPKPLALDALEAALFPSRP